MKEDFLVRRVMARKQHLPIILAAALLAIITVSYFFYGGSDYARHGAAGPGSAQNAPPKSHEGALSSFEGKPIGSGEIEGIAAPILEGGSIAPKLENATAKYVLFPTPQQPIKPR